MTSRHLRRKNRGAENSKLDFDAGSDEKPRLENKEKLRFITLLLIPNFNICFGNEKANAANHNGNS